MKEYRHFKGGLYKLLHIAEHSETQEQLVVYMNQDEKVYVRPYDMFFGTVEVDGVIKKRFTEIKSSLKN